jgi:predicted kinase
LPFFLSLRAAIRAKVEAANRPHVQGEARAKLETTARRYFDFALAFLAPTSARLVAIGGLSGTGKSALARSLASELGRPPGAVWLRSDVERKRLFAVAETTRLGDAAYSAEVSREVYARLNRKAALALGAERAAIIDAAHAHADDRLQSFATARAAGVAFAGLWLEAPLATRLERIAKATPKNYRFTLGVRGAML